ncbi:hypothetical protein C8R47DRAFT_1194472 [Mycena vitilis]|nr:hypothetical protein C8R47DRAFT_1194472 [Mycena vitilis]
MFARQAAKAVPETVQKTVDLLQHTAKGTFVPERWLLVGQGVPPPNDQLVEELESLARTAESAATSVLCSSILAGNGSEGDDFGDAAIWLGKGAFGKGHEQAVLKSLGLEGRISGGDEISPVDLDAKTHIPAGNKCQETAELKALSKKLDEWQDLHCFSLKGSGSEVIYSLVGTKGNGWGGLVGVGIET